MRLQFRRTRLQLEDSRNRGKVLLEHGEVLLELLNPVVLELRSLFYARQGMAQ